MPTLKEAPSDAATPGHQYLIRAGLIRKSHQGGFALLPLGLRVFEKATGLIDEAMSSVGASKVSLPTMLPAEMWKKSGRWETTGPEMIQLQDRHQNWFCLAPTHEESITSMVAGDLTSQKQLPIRLYQIGTKFRDEIRPRFGLLRAREFVMKVHRWRRRSLNSPHPPHE